MQAHVHACTTRSATHDRNQDRAVVGDAVLASTADVEHREVGGPAIIAVLDGLGGHPAGDVASEVAGQMLASADVPGGEDGTSQLLQRADIMLQDAMRDRPERFGMGTTVAMLALGANGHGTVANVGDSTVFRLADGGHLDQLTVTDRAAGSTIRQCLGATGDYVVEPHAFRIELSPGELYLLATDGLTDVVPLPDIEAALRRDPAHAVEVLHAAVDEAGRPDDVTIVVVETLDGDAQT